MNGRRQLISLAVLMLALPPGEAQTSGNSQVLDRALASEPAVVTTTGGRTFRGLLDGLREGRLHLRIATDGGEVGYSFAREEMAALALPGVEIEAQAMELWDRGEAAGALPLLEALGRQRMRYLPLLTKAQRESLLVLVQASEAAGDPLSTIGYARAILPHVASAEERAPLNDAVLSAHVLLGMREEARRLATEWCREADPSGSSALGWCVLAGLALDEGNPDRALWIALQPVVFASYLPTRHLDQAYALAVASADRLIRTGTAQRLFLEMRERGLVWPIGPRFDEVGSRYAQTIGTAREDQPPDSPSIPAELGDLPEFDEVRKLAGAPSF